MGTRTDFILLSIFFPKLLHMAMVLNFEVMFGLTLNRCVCVEFYNFVQCNILVNYVTFCLSISVSL
jgi:hypothetical protein